MPFLLSATRTKRTQSGSDTTSDASLPSVAARSPGPSLSLWPEESIALPTPFVLQKIGFRGFTNLVCTPVQLKTLNPDPRGQRSTPPCDGDFPFRGIDT
jgi:hypothetical protein